jgi:uncharacterized protein YjbJ (UPF0337 family)
MGRRKRSSTGNALDKAVGRLAETAGTASGDKTLEAEGRATQRVSERKTYVVTTHADGGWKVQVEGSRRATSVHKTKGEAQGRGGGERQGTGEESPAKPTTRLQAEWDRPDGANLRLARLPSLGVERTKAVGSGYA